MGDLGEQENVVVLVELMCCLRELVDYEEPGKWTEPAGLTSWTRQAEDEQIPGWEVTPGLTGLLTQAQDGCGGWLWDRQSL